MAIVATNIFQVSGFARTCSGGNNNILITSKKLDLSKHFYKKYTFIITYKHTTNSALKIMLMIELLIKLVAKFRWIFSQNQQI